MAVALGPSYKCNEFLVLLVLVLACFLDRELTLDSVKISSLFDLFLKPNNTVPAKLNLDRWYYHIYIFSKNISHYDKYMLLLDSSKNTFLDVSSVIFRP